MKIKVAKSAGFCWGVKRAVNIAVEAAKKGKGKAYCLGELIHNKREIERLRAIGIDFVEDTELLSPGNTVIIRSHGVAPSVIDYLKKKGLYVVDATCPFVKEVHDKAVKLEKEGYPILILGNPKHPEVEGIAGHVKEPVIVNSLEELRKLPHFLRLGVVCQTTLNMGFFREAVSILALKVKELKIYNTICKATTVRQKETKKLALQVDVMLIVGGKNSSNTTKLYQISKSVNDRSYHIECKEEIDPSWFEGAEVVGVTAGASTPQWVIDEVVAYLRLLGEGGSWSGRGICKAVRG